MGVGMERVKKQRNRQFKRIYYSIWFKHFKMREYLKYTSGSYLKANSKMKLTATCIFVSKLEKKIKLKPDTNILSLKILK